MHWQLLNLLWIAFTPNSAILLVNKAIQPEMYFVTDLHQLQAVLKPNLRRNEWLFGFGSSVN